MVARVAAPGGAQRILCEGEGGWAWRWRTEIGAFAGAHWIALPPLTKAPKRLPGGGLDMEYTPPGFPAWSYPDARRRILALWLPRTSLDQDPEVNAGGQSLDDAKHPVARRGEGHYEQLVPT